jgi:hypothetical protein
VPSKSLPLAGNTTARNQASSRGRLLHYQSAHLILIRNPALPDAQVNQARETECFPDVTRRHRNLHSNRKVSVEGDQPHGLQDRLGERHMRPPEIGVPSCALRDQLRIDLR